MTAPPTVTVVICCFNHERYAEQALDSVAAQTQQPTQLLITDDASTDGSVAVIERWIERRWPGAEFVRNETNRGLPATLNDVLPRVKGDFVALMSGDDWMAPERLELQLQAFAASPPSVGMVYSDMIEVDGTGSPTGQKWFDADRMGPPLSGNLFAAMVERAFMAAPSVLVRNDVLRSVGGYDEALVAEDYDMFLRLSRVADWAFVSTPLIYYRVLPSSLSRSDDFLGTYRTGRIRLLKKHVGVSPETDLVIARRVAQMAESLYKEGRDPAETAADLRFALDYVPTARRRALLWLAKLHVPGTWMVRLRKYSRRRQVALPALRGE